MPSVRNGKKVRPVTASGVLQSREVTHVLDEFRPATAPGKTNKNTAKLGFDPTFLTSRHHVPGTLTSSTIKGRQVHGGIPEYDLKRNAGRRSSLSNLKPDKTKRPSTAAAGQKLRVKVRVKIRVENFRPSP